MNLKLNSTAPHIYPAGKWEEAWGIADGALTHDAQSRVIGLALHKDGNQQPDMGVRRFYPGRGKLRVDSDMLCHFMTGKGTFRSETGEAIEIGPGVVVHLKTGWNGEADIEETADATYMRFAGGPAAKTPVLRDPLNAGPLTEWGEVSKPLVGHSKTAGILLSREADKSGETGIWTCTPGTWRCVVKRDEFCHFIAGASTYAHDNGEVIEVRPDTLGYFPAGWSGQCQLHETVRKVYVIR